MPIEDRISTPFNDAISLDARLLNAIANDAQRRARARGFPLEFPGLQPFLLEDREELGADRILRRLGEMERRLDRPDWTVRHDNRELERNQRREQRAFYDRLGIKGLRPEDV